MEETQPILIEESQAKPVTYRVYKRRWAIIVTVMLLCISSRGCAFNLAAVAYKAADYFEVTQHEITRFTQVYFIVPIIFSFASTFIFNKFDMKAGIHIGSALNCVGAMTRALATSGVITDVWAQYIISLVGQSVAAMGLPFIAFIITKITQNWFPDDGRMMATAVMCFFPPLGISVAQVMSPLLVTKKQQVPTLNYVYGVIAILAELVTILCVTRSRPPTPPSRSAPNSRSERREPVT